jgi:hypothetical protein
MIEKLFPLMEALNAKKVIENMINARQFENYKGLCNKDVETSDLMALNDNELIRRRTIEDKAKNNITALTIAFSLMALILTQSGSICNPNSQLDSELQKHIVYFFSIIAVIYFVLGWWCAFEALEIGEIYYWDLSDKIQIKTKNKISIKLIEYIELNKKNTMIKANFVMASYNNIRLGIYSLIFLFLIIVPNNYFLSIFIVVLFLIIYFFINMIYFKNLNSNLMSTYKGMYRGLLIFIKQMENRNMVCWQCIHFRIYSDFIELIKSTTLIYDKKYGNDINKIKNLINLNYDFWVKLKHRLFNHCNETKIPNFKEILKLSKSLLKKLKKDKSIFLD